jgi:hypothetical protein
VVHRTYDVGGEIFGLRASSAAVGEWLDATFSRYVVDRPPPQNFYHYSVHTPDTAGPGLGRRFATLYVGSGVSVRTFSLRVLAEAIINEFSVWPSVRSADGAFLDAGVARVGGLTVLVQGRLIKWMGEHQIRARRSGVTLSAEVAVSLDAATKTVGRLPRLDLPDDAVESLVSLLGAAGLEDGAIDRFTLDTPVARLRGASSSSLWANCSQASPATRSPAAARRRSSTPLFASRISRSDAARRSSRTVSGPTWVRVSTLLHPQEIRCRREAFPRTPRYHARQLRRTDEGGETWIRRSGFLVGRCFVTSVSLVLLHGLRPC